MYVHNSRWALVGDLQTVYDRGIGMGPAGPHGFSYSCMYLFEQPSLWSLPPRHRSPSAASCGRVVRRSGSAAHPPHLPSGFPSWSPSGYVPFPLPGRVFPRLPCLMSLFTSSRSEAPFATSELQRIPSIATADVGLHPSSYAQFFLEDPTLKYGSFLCHIQFKEALFWGTEVRRPHRGPFQHDAPCWAPVSAKSITDPEAACLRASEPAHGYTPQLWVRGKSIRGWGSGRILIITRHHHLLSEAHPPPPPHPRRRVRLCTDHHEDPHPPPHPIRYPMFEDAVDGAPLQVD